MRRLPQDGRGVAIVGYLAILFLALPLVVVAVASLDPGEFFNFPPTDISARWYATFLGDEDWMASLRLSLLISALSAATATIVGGAAGIAVARSDPRWRRAAYALLLAPLTVPVIVLALAYYGLILRTHLVGNVVSFVVANALLTAPVVALLVTAAALKVDTHVEMASLACGATAWRTLVKVTAPLIAPTAMAGGVLSFLLSLDEVVLSLFLVAPGRTPLAVRMFLQSQTGNPPILLAAATLLIVVSVVVIGSVTIFERAGRGSSTDDSKSADGPSIALPGLVD